MVTAFHFFQSYGLRKAHSCVTGFLLLSITCPARMLICATGLLQHEGKWICICSSQMWYSYSGPESWYWCKCCWKSPLAVFDTFVQFTSEGGLFKTFCFKWILPPSLLQSVFSQPSALLASEIPSLLVALFSFGAYDLVFHRNCVLPCITVHCFGSSISCCR